MRQIKEFIASDSPQAAEGIIRAILLRSRQLAEFPKSGREARRYGNRVIRELLEEPYRALYEIQHDRLFVLAHGRRDLPDFLRHLEERR
jgi:toxin ParE1/3/4